MADIEERVKNLKDVRSEMGRKLTINICRILKDAIKKGECSGLFSACDYFTQTREEIMPGLADAIYQMFRDTDKEAKPETKKYAAVEVLRTWDKLSINAEKPIFYMGVPLGEFSNKELVTICRILYEKTGYFI